MCFETFPKYCDNSLQFARNPHNTGGGHLEITTPPRLHHSSTQTSHLSAEIFLATFCCQATITSSYKIWCTRNRLNFQTFYVHESLFYLVIHCCPIVRAAVVYLRHLRWTLPSPHRTMYVEFNEGIDTHDRYPLRST